MRIFFIIIVLFCSKAFAQEKKNVDNVNLKLEQLNILAGKKNRYAYDGKTVKIYKQCFNSFYVRKAKVTLTKVNNDNLTCLLTAICSKQNIRNKEYADNSILDGFKWSVEIRMNEEYCFFDVINIYNEDLDKIIEFINGIIHQKKRYIITSAYFYE